MKSLKYFSKIALHIFCKHFLSLVSFAGSRLNSKFRCAALGSTALTRKMIFEFSIREQCVAETTIMRAFYFILASFKRGQRFDGGK